MNLIPNCSEATFRIDISNLTATDIKKIKFIWDHHIKDYMKKEELDEEPEGSELYEKEIFDKKLLEADGDFPYNCNGEINHIIFAIEKALNKKLKTESENR